MIIEMTYALEMLAADIAVIIFAIHEGESKINVVAIVEEMWVIESRVVSVGLGVFFSGPGQVSIATLRNELTYIRQFDGLWGVVVVIVELDSQPIIPSADLHNGSNLSIQMLCFRKTSNFNHVPLAKYGLYDDWWWCHGCRSS